MQVLGDLIELPKSSHIPLPWWHRAPLGLQSQSWCYVGLVASPKSSRPVADLIVSLLNPAKWKDMLRVKAIHPDEPGVVTKAIANFKNLNIALAESVTIDAGASHAVTFFLEAVAKGKAPPQNLLKRALEQQGFKNVYVDQYSDTTISWLDIAQIRGGWIRDLNWRAEMKSLFPNAKNIDLTKAVVSADTTTRMLRFTFPHSNARTIRIEHSDEPEVLRKITNVFKKNSLNMLSMVLRRGGAPPGKATLLATCEPVEESAGSEIYNHVDADVKQLPPELMISAKIYPGIFASKSISTRSPGTIVARIPIDLLSKVQEFNRSKPTNDTLSIFFSRRIVNEDKRNEEIERRVKDILNTQGCQILDGSVEDHDVAAQNLVFPHISAKMWAADAVIILVTKLKSGDDPVAKNLPLEFGFFQGQSKPILLLVEGDVDSKALPSNIDGIFAHRFEGEALGPENANSVHYIVNTWLKRVRENLFAIRTEGFIY